METNRQTAVKSLAVVGFLALLGVGIWSAVYSARYMPTLVNSVGSAAVYLGSIFGPATDEPADTTPENATPSVISFGSATTTSVGTSTVPAVKPAALAPKKPTTTTTTIVTGPVVAAPHGLSDLAIQASVVGYLTTNSTDSFVPGTTVPSGNRPAVKFTIKNVGTNYSGTWRFVASLPTRTSYTYTSNAQQSLGAGESVDYVLGFDLPSRGDQQPLVVTVNDDRSAIESSYTNNTVEFRLNIK